MKHIDFFIPPQYVGVVSMLLEICVIDLLWGLSFCKTLVLN
jgi:hypothetical protein